MDVASVPRRTTRRGRSSRNEVGVVLPDHLSQFFAEEPELIGANLEAVMKAALRTLDIAVGGCLIGSPGRRAIPAHECRERLPDGPWADARV